MTSIILERSILTPNGSGGYVKSAPAPLPPQDLMVIPLQDAVGERQNEDGTLVRPSYMILGTVAADIERWDTFTLDGRRYKVVFILQNQTYQIKAEVIYLGE